MAIGAGTEERGHRARRPVAGGERRDLPLDRQLALMERQIDGLPETHRGRHVAIEIIDRGSADRCQHLATILRGMGQVTHQPRPAT